MIRLGPAIRICRAAQNMKQTDLAQRLSISPSHVSLIESGRRDPSLDTLGQIASALQVPPHVLMGIADPEAALKDASALYAIGRWLIEAGR